MFFPLLIFPSRGLAAWREGGGGVRGRGERQAGWCGERQRDSRERGFDERALEYFPIVMRISVGDGRIIRVHLFPCVGVGVYV